MRARIFNIMQYEVHPTTGESLIDEHKIQVALAHKTIKRWAYICHDRDVYSAKDEADSPVDENGNKLHIMGQTKPRHWHIVCECPRAAEVDAIAKWFGIPENFVDVPKGHGAFLDCVEYLTHEAEEQQRQKKTLYGDEEICSNFKWREELTERAARKLKYGVDLSDKERIRNEVLYEGLTLSQLKSTPEGKRAYADDQATLDRFRLKYIETEAPFPSSRTSYYITGTGGFGKGCLSRMLARSLFPDLHNDREIFFEVADAGFQGYDGQPVIIWNDFRAFDLLKLLNGRGNVFNVFDSHPADCLYNVKYGRVRLINQYNIVNSVQPYKEFLAALVGEYKDKSGQTVKSEAAQLVQATRRFPVISEVHEDYFEVLVNQGYYQDADWEEYKQLARVKGNLKRMMELTERLPEKRLEFELRATRPYVALMEEMAQRGELIDEAYVDEQLAGFGEIVGPASGSDELPFPDASTGNEE